MRDRRDIHDLHDTRLKARDTFVVDLEVAKTALHPREMARRWTNKQKAKVGEIAGNAAGMAKKNSRLIAATVIGALLLMSRKPISTLTRKLWQKRKTEQDLT